MAIMMTLWSTLLGNKKSRMTDVATVASSPNKMTSDSSKAKSRHGERKAPQPLSARANQLEKGKLLSTRRTVIESHTHDKLDLSHLRARINEQSHEYVQNRQRQQQAISRWFGQPAALFDEVALTKRLAEPVRILDLQALEAQFEQTLNFSDINLPDYYQSYESDDEVPPLTAVDDDIPELEELLARLQIMDRIEMLEEEQHAPSTDEVLFDADLAEVVELHLVAPIALVESEFEAPVELLKHRRKGKKNRRRNRDAVRA